MASLQASAASSATSGVMPLPSTSSPAHSASQPGSTPTASPAMQNQQRPTSSKGHSSMPTAAASQLPWPMPTVAVNTVSPVVTASSSAHEQQQRSSYYRPRPNQTDTSGKSTTMAQPPTAHQFNMYAPNGMRKENGKWHLKTYRYCSWRLWCCTFRPLFARFLLQYIVYTILFVCISTKLYALQA